MSRWVEVLLAAAAVTGALTALFRFLHLGELIKGTRLFLVDWFGTPERPGAEARPGFPERMSLVERRTADLAHDFRGELTSRLTLLAFTVDKTHEKLATTTDRLLLIEERVSDHRRRNEEAILLLREAVARNEERLEEVRQRGHRVRATDPPGTTYDQELPP